MTTSEPENMGGILAQVRKPSRYIGNEFNACRKNWDTAKLRVALVFPDLYEIGMSHHGLQILYAIINDQENMLADRAYAPDRDLEELLQSRGSSLFGVESRRPLAEFDMLGFTLPYELCYTNILTILALSGIPLQAAMRNDSHPFVVGGGAGSFNPEPVADFFDAVLLGDGEEAVLEITTVLQRAKETKACRRETLEGLAAIPGVYVPAFFVPRYDRHGKLVAIDPLKTGYTKIRRRILSDLEFCHIPGKPLVPLVRIVHDRLGIEVARGCTRGCRFCQAGIIYRPVRERRAASVMELAEKGMQAGGFEELALLSLSTGDYSCLPVLLGPLMDRFAREYVSVSMPSMRVGTLTPEIMQQIKRVRKTGFTVAPEAGTDRLRNVINKGITEEDLLATCRDANALGWKLLKFYFMIGLPTETREDIRAIGDLVHRAGSTSDHRRLQINVSVSAFVPKPHTPFQWERQIAIDEVFARINLLKTALPKRGCKLKWHDPHQSFLEGVMARGDRLLSRVIAAAWQRGARLDAWSEHFDPSLWHDAARDCDIDLDHYLRARDLSEILPWHHLNTGIDREFLLAELVKSQAGTYTKDCRVHGCQKCGACDFKEVMPVVQCKGSLDAAMGTGKETQAVNIALPTVDRAPVPTAVDMTPEAEPHCWYRLFYAKQEDSRFLSHLEVIQVFFQAFRRAGLELHHTQGFNPVPKASFSPALPVGTASLAEYLDVDLTAEIAAPDTFLLRVNSQLPQGMKIMSVAALPDKKNGGANETVTCYRISLDTDLSQADRESLRKFMACDTFVLKKIIKGRPRVLDIRNQVESLKVSEDSSLELVLHSQDGKAAAKPAEILKAVLDLSASQCFAMDILKVWSKEKSEGERKGPGS